MRGLVWFGDKQRHWCEQAGFLVHVELLPVRQHFAWTVEDIRMLDYDDAELLASGVAESLEEAQECATGILRAHGVLRVVRYRPRKGSNVVDLHPAGVWVEKGGADT